MVMQRWIGFGVAATAFFTLSTLQAQALSFEHREGYQRACARELATAISTIEAEVNNPNNRINLTMGSMIPESAPGEMEKWLADSGR